MLAPSDRPLDPPDVVTAKKIAQDLQRQLQSPRPQFHSHGCPPEGTSQEQRSRPGQAGWSGAGDADDDLIAGR